MKRTLKHALAAVILVLSFATPVMAGPFEKPPLKLSEDTINGINDILEAADAGRNGNYATALRIYQKMADRGDAFGQVHLGVLYEKGQGVPQNYAEAAKWYRKAADQGDAIAQYNLGVIYAEGRSMPKNYAEALKLYRLAAGQGYDRAQSNLGVMYAEGLGVPKDYVRAHMWFNLSAAQGYEDAVTNQNLVTQSMTPAQLVKAQKLAREWKPTPGPYKEHAALDSLQKEASTCIAYYTIVQECGHDAGASKVVYEQSKLMVKKTIDVSGMVGLGIKMSEEVMTARGKASMEEQMALINGNCTNISLLESRHAARCKKLIENPASVLGEYTKK